MTQTSFLNKPHGICGLVNHMCIDYQLVHGTYAIRRIPFACTFCTYSLGQPWIPVFPAQQQPRYQTIKYYTYWPVSVSFNNWNILKLSHKATYSEEIDKIYQVVLDGISDNNLHWYKQVNIVPLIKKIHP